MAAASPGPTAFPSDPAAYLDAALGIFEQAAATFGGPTFRTYAIGGFAIRLGFAGPDAVRAFGRALAHLEVANDGPADLTVHVWDSASTGTEPLRPGWSTEDYGPRGEIRRFNDDRFNTLVETGPQILRMVDNARAVGINWIKDLRNVPYPEIGAPLRPLFHDWFWRRGLVPVHGGAVGLAEGGVLLVGAGGAGKSNSAMACVNSALKYLSDDFCLLSRAPEWTAHSLYGTGKLRDADFARLPQHRPMIGDDARASEEKTLLFIGEHSPEALIRRLPLRAIVAPRVCGGEACRLVPANGAQLHRALAISTMQMSWATARATFEAVASLIRTLPCHELQLGTRMDAVPQLLRELIPS